MRTPLYLFSSNQSPLYAQDILNVLAAPPGYEYGFRYAARYIDQDARDAWLTLQDTPVIVIFSLQQEARYHDPAFIPIRRGYVTSTSAEGDARFVTFRVTDYVSLAPAPVVDGRERPDVTVLDFSRTLREHTATPYAVSASLGSSPPSNSWEDNGDASVLFSRTATYLSHTQTFAAARFVRVLGIKQTGLPDAARIQTTLVDPTFVLDAGRTYDLEFFHSQPTAPSVPQRFFIDIDGSVLTTIGRGQFDVASRYDRLAVQIATSEAVGLEDRRTVLAIEPAPEVQGPRIVMPIRVVARRGRAVGLAAAQALALVTVALAGALSKWPLGARLSLAIVGALAAVGIGLLGGSVLRTPMLPASPNPTSPQAAPVPVVPSDHHPAA